MRHTLVFILLSSVAMSGCAALSELSWRSNSLPITDIVKTCRADVFAPVSGLKVLQRMAVLHESGAADALTDGKAHSAYWILSDATELQALKLESLEVYTVNGRLMAIYLKPIKRPLPQDVEFAENLALFGLKPESLTGHKMGRLVWYTADGVDGLPITIRENGTWVECNQVREGSGLEKVRDGSRLDR